MDLYPSLPHPNPTPSPQHHPFLYNFWSPIVNLCCLFCLQKGSQFIKMPLFPLCLALRTNGRSPDWTQGTDQARVIRLTESDLTEAWAGIGPAPNTWKMMRVSLGRWEKKRVFRFLLFLYYIFFFSTFNMVSFCTINLLLPWLKWTTYNLTKIFTEIRKDNKATEEKGNLSYKWHER